MTNTLKRWLLGLFPLILLSLLVGLFLVVGPLGLFRTILPPNQEVFVERTILTEDAITLHVVNEGPDPVVISQVMVNGAFWRFEITPKTPVSRLGRAVIRIPYPWVEGDTEHITLLTAEGVTFDTEIEMATRSPSPDPTYFATFALLGVYVGVVPVFLGLLWLPFLRGLPGVWYRFILSLTVGLLVFLGVDAFSEAVELTRESPSSFHGVGVLTIGGLLSFLAISAIGQESRKRAGKTTDEHMGLVLAFLVAFGIGVHNLGEGLAIGGAYAVGQASLGALLVIGFMIHNVTEGVAIVAPVARFRPRVSHLAFMGLLAGGPTVLGTWIGGFAYTAIWSVFFLAVGSGAVFQVVVQIVRQMPRGSEDSVVTAGNVSGFLLGLAVMYVTGLFVTA
ncbi:MAG: ZIP family metal transporter [Fidelibacterota bacterium]